MSTIVVFVENDVSSYRCSAPVANTVMAPTRPSGDMRVRLAARQLDCVNRLELRVEQHRLVSGEHATVRRQAQAMAGGERHAFAIERDRRPVGGFARIERSHAQPAVIPIDRRVPEQQTRRGGYRRDLAWRLRRRDRRPPRPLAPDHAHQLDAGDDKERDDHDAARNHRVRR
jgi:hypothetical protein